MAPAFAIAARSGNLVARTAHTRAGARSKAAASVAATAWQRLEGACFKMRCMVGENRLNYLVHVGNVLALVAVTREEMLDLRVFMVLSSSFSIAFNLMQPRPLYVPVCWGLFFMGIHGYQIRQILNEKKLVYLAPCEERLYERTFLPYGFTPRSFKRILQLSHATWETYQPGDKIFEQGWGLQSTAYMLSGTARIVRNGNVINRIVGDPKKLDKNAEGNWIGQPWDRSRDFSKSMRWQITVEAETEVEVVRFDIKGFHQAISEDAGRRLAADKLQIQDLWGKLRRTTSLVRSNDKDKLEKIVELSSQLRKEVVEAYTAMIQLAVSDGVLTKEEITACQAYRKSHGITDEQHAEALAKAGWGASFEPSHDARPGLLAAVS